MIEELNKAIGEYQTKWQALVAGRRDKVFFESLKPTSVGWKTEDLADFNKRFAEMRDDCEQIHLVWLNGRWIATMILRDTKLDWGIATIKLMQRRPNSADAVGLDHVDFYSPHAIDSQTIAAKEPDLKLTDEVNGLCKWTSLWFDGTEAKLRHETVIDVG